MILGFSAIDFVSLNFLRVSSQSRASFTYPLRLISSRKARGVRIVLAQLLSSSSRALAQALGRTVHVDEVFAQTHVRKSTNQFVDERSPKTRVRSEHGSAPTPDDARQLAANYTTSRGGTLKHQPSSSTTTADKNIERLTQLLQKRDQENHDLRENYSDSRTEFTNFKSLVMKALPDASGIHSTVPPTQPRPSSSPVVPQQPTPLQPSIEQQDDEDHSDDDYVDY
ncbi:hypothetical protein LR48_Vigan01g077200 [Vigna angularis]|uniref:Uncharacterized protein n=1 Tax=Phaseolus angularis TaxID=3914 RepID=A0A0L9TL99_PHAAN|nr:hypothetical protein LR48_Vigan01g077200 [Vigna angularis]